MKEEKTNAVRLMAQKKLDFSLHSYLSSGAISGIEVAEALGHVWDTVFKTLVTVGRSGAHYVYMVPVAEELDLKKAAAVVGEKSIEMIKSKELLPLTGYVHGGCSPVGMKKTFRTIAHASMNNCDKIFFSGGKIGLQIETTPTELTKIVKLEFADIVKKL